VISMRPRALLFARFGSLAVDDASTFKNPPSPPKACIATVAVASPLLLMLPSEKSTDSPVRVQVPWVVVAETGEPSEP
jgi:hypothetical protein